MAWDAVPWFVGGGAHHSPEVARMLAYAATGGAEGIITPGDLRVTPTTVPSGSVDIAPGDCLIRHRGQGGDSQTYAARNHTRDNVTVAATGGTARSDLIVAQIEDPFVAGAPWQEPADVTAGPYIFTRVIPNVPPWATRLQDVPGFEGRTAIVLARVDVPANTGTITSDLITDLRQLAMPRSERKLYVHNLAGSAELQSQTAVKWLPDTMAIEIPSWATSLQMLVTVNRVYECGTQQNHQVFAEVWPQFLGLGGWVCVIDDNQTAWTGNGATSPPIICKWDTIEDPNKRGPLMAAAGTTQQLEIWGKKNVVIAADAGWLSARAGCTMIAVDCQFSEVPV